MLKRLAIVGLFVLVGVAAGQNPPPNAPKIEITKSDGGSKGEEQPKSQSNNQTTPPPVAASPKPTTPTCDESCQNARQNLQIQNRLVWLTGGLVLVGLLQVGSMIWQAILLRQTRGDVKRQADWIETQAGHMDRQTGILEKSVAASQTSADAAKQNAEVAAESLQVFIGKERPRLSVSPGFYFSNFFCTGGVSTLSLFVYNIGPTTARNVSLRASILTAPGAKHPPAEQWRGCKIPTIIKTTKDKGDPERVDVRFIYELDLAPQFEIQNSLDVQGAAKLKELAHLGREERDAAFNRGSFSLDRKLFQIDICGVLRYSGLTVKEHELWFRYAYIPSEVRIVHSFSDKTTLQWESEDGKWNQIGGKADNRET